MYDIFLQLSSVLNDQGRVCWAGGGDTTARCGSPAAGADEGLACPEAEDAEPDANVVPCISE